MWDEVSLTLLDMSITFAWLRKGNPTNEKQWEKRHLKELKVNEMIKGKNGPEDVMNRENAGPREEKI